MERKRNCLSKIGMGGIANREPELTESQPLEEGEEELATILKIKFEIREKTDAILIANGFKNTKGLADWKKFNKWEREAMTRWYYTQSQRFEQGKYVAVMEEPVAVPENAQRFRLGKQRIVIHTKK